MNTMDIMDKNISIGVNAIVIKKALEYINWLNVFKENKDNKSHEYHEYYKYYIKKSINDDVKQFIDKKVNINNYLTNTSIDLIVQIIKINKYLFYKHRQILRSDYNVEDILVKYNTKCNHEFHNDYKNVLKDQLYINYEGVFTNIKIYNWALSTLNVSDEPPEKNWIINIFYY